MTNGALLAYSDRTDSFLPMVCPLGVPHASKINGADIANASDVNSMNAELVD